MRCEFCNTEMVVDGGGMTCPKCGNWLSSLEVKYGREPPIENFDQKKWEWH